MDSPQKTAVIKIDKFSTRDGRGIRTVVFLKGCPLRCKWCHSPESWSFQIEKYPDGEQIGTMMSTDEVLEEVLKDKDFYDASGGGMTLSGGEALAHPEFAVELLKKAKSAGIHAAVETSGCAAPRVLEAFLPHVDMWLWDVKHLDEQKHILCTGKPLKPILENLRRVSEFVLSQPDSRREIVLRCPMIPGANDDSAELAALARLADSLGAVSQIDIEPYIPFGLDKARRLNLPVEEFPIPTAGFGEKIVSELSKLTSKPVRLP